MCVAACRYKNYVHATFFGRPLVGAGDKHSCVYIVCFLTLRM
jgi:hypothetical protein